MYEISNGSRYSYFSIDEHNVSNKPTEDKNNSFNLNNQIMEIEQKENYLENLYTACMDEYQSTNTLYDNMSFHMQQSLIDRISSINAQKRELDERKRYLLRQINQHKSNTFLESQQTSNKDYHPTHLSSCDYIQKSPLDFLPKIVPVKIDNPIPIDVWSFEIFKHTCSRTLNKQKFVSPGSLLRETRLSYGHYNYTYFNDQKPEEMEVFDYTPSPMPSIPDKKLSLTKCEPIKPPVMCKPPPVDANRTVCIDDIINRSVDSRHVIILRGLPGSGKSTFCQAFKEKEMINGRSAPRILSIDHFFVDDGKFEYDPDLEPTYRHELFKLFKRQIDEGFFSVILVDCINEKVEQFSQFYQYAKMSRFQVSVLELKVAPTICAKRSENRFTQAQIYKMAEDWEEIPSQYDKLDANSFLQDSSIEDVEMEDIIDEKPQEESDGDSEENLVTETGFFKSKWDEDFEDTKERLDGMKPISHDPHTGLSIREYLRIEMENLNKSNSKERSRGKQVKWADFEELKKQKRRKELGFVAGNTDWSKLMSSDIEVAEAALVQVRYFNKDSD